MILSLRKPTVSVRRLKITRTSNWIQEQVVQLLRASPYRELAGTVCRVLRGVVILEGDVSSYYMKQLAQTVARRVPGVLRIVNHIHVRTLEEQREFAAQQKQWHHVGRLNDGRPRSV